MAKSYEQFCAIALALDRLGERWTLLILRELSIGDQRFTDLRRALPGIAPNLLSDRLHALQDDGLVEQVELPPPAARSVYRLTGEGRRVLPVLRALAKFGAQDFPARPGGMPVRRALIALLAPWTVRDAGALELVVEADGERQQIRLEDDHTTVLAVEGDHATALRIDLADLTAARRDGTPLRAEVADAKAAARFAEAYDLQLA
jgi:DNA-binding HxlR family transcriptional regulator